MASDPTFEPKRRPRLWPWFVGGFLACFVGMLVGATALSYRGNALWQVPLWYFYWLEFPNPFGFRAIGPNDGSAFYVYALQHLGASLVSGAAMVGLRWLVGKVRREN